MYKKRFSYGIKRCRSAPTPWPNSALPLTYGKRRTIMGIKGLLSELGSLGIGKVEERTRLRPFKAEKPNTMG